MKKRTHTRTARPLALLLLVAMVAALSSLSFHPHSATYAQTETSETLEVPVLTAISTGANAVELSWTAVTAAVRYDLWAWQDSAAGWQRLDDGSLTSTSYTHGGLTAGATYLYTVRAVDANGATSDWSKYATATVAATQSQLSTPTPTASTQIAATSTPTSTPDSTTFAHVKPVLSAVAAAGAVELSWTAVAAALRYDLWAWQDSATGWQRLDDGSLTSASYTHGGLTAGTTYLYTVRAVDANGAASAWSEYVKATVSDARLPTATPTTTRTSTPGPTPTPTATASASELSIPQLTAQATESGVRLTWEPVPHAARYSLVVWWDPGTGWQPLGGDSLTGTTYTHTAVTSGTTYYYSIRALSAAGETSDWLLDYPAATALAAKGGATPTPTVTPTPATSERGALIALYEATHGANWTHNDNWLTDKPISTWYGVTVDRNGRVTTLDLANNNLTGQIPDLSALANLTYLYLYGNRLTGQIPNLSALTKLIQLYLGYNRLTGQISGPSLPANLQSLSLRGNRLTGQIPDLSALSELTDLWLSENQLAGTIPTTLGNHPYLGELHLRDNQLTGTIPAALGNLPLYSLYLSGNTLSGCIPAELRSVRDSDLESLGLPYCAPAPTATPTPGATPTPATSERAALIALYQATGGANWKRNNNWLTDKPIDLWYGVTADGSGRVTALNLWQNQLSGPIPNLSALSNLTLLDLGQNELTGPIPDLSALANLTELDFRHNQLTGQIPDLSSLANLDHLDLGFNRLTGSIPELSALTNLTYLHLRANRLTGQIPDLSALANLRKLYLSHNRLTGQIPDLSTLANLTELDLGDGNELTGQIPELGALTNLTELNLRQNDLTGQIPDLSTLSKLAQLNLSHNRLTGQIPDLSALSNLTFLSLSGNRLTGPIPELSALANLVTLGLNDNRLTGPILNVNALANLQGLYLRNNRLTGPVPDLSALTNLGNLDLSGNQLCLPAGYDLPGSSSVVTGHLNHLNLPACTDADLAAAPAAPQNLTAAVGDGQVTLSWDAVADAAGYDLWVWDSIDRQFGPIGGALTGRSYAHTVRQDGRNYYYQVRAYNAGGARGAWSKRVQAIVVPQQFLPPPHSLGLELFYQKYLEVGGLHVVAPSEVSNTKMVQTREIITGMLSARSDLLQAMAGSGTLIAIRPGIKIAFAGQSFGGRFKFGAHVPAVDGKCYVLIHEFAHLIHFVLEELPGGDEFNRRLQAAYQAALTAGLWDEEYASTNTSEYWAETVTFWFQESIRHSSIADSRVLEDHDPAAAQLIEDTLGDATVPSYCKP